MDKEFNGTKKDPLARAISFMVFGEAAAFIGGCLLFAMSKDVKTDWMEFVYSTFGSVLLAFIVFTIDIFMPIKEEPKKFKKADKGDKI